MKLTQQIRSKIMQWEGCRLTAYKCPAGVLTIGYGHTGPDVTEGLTISPAHAVALFNADLDRFARQVARIVAPAQLSDNQFSALVSFAYNCGAGALSKSALLKRVKANPADPEIRAEFLKYSKAVVRGSRQVLPGLLRRRTEEADIYFM